jgi:hypothetical protein
MEEPKLWERLDHETDKAYEAFCRYLALPPRDSKAGRRFQADLAVELNTTVPNLSRWFTAFDWEERAKAYDAYLSTGPLQIAELQARREFIAEVRQAGKTFRERAEETIACFPAEAIRMEDAIKLYNLGMRLEQQAQKIEEPGVKDQRESLKANIRELLGALASAELGRAAGGGARGTIVATERTVSFQPSGNGGRHGEVREIPAATGPVRDGSPGGDALAGADPVSEPREDESEDSL